jgi:hypothetical protein
MQNLFRLIRQSPPIIWLPWLGNIFMCVAGLTSLATPYSLRGPSWSILVIALTVALSSYFLRKILVQRSVNKILNAAILVALLSFSISSQQLAAKYLSLGLFGVFDFIEPFSKSYDIVSPQNTKSFTLTCSDEFGDDPNTYRIYVNKFFLFHKQAAQFTSGTSCDESPLSSFNWPEGNGKAGWGNPRFNPPSGSFYVD